MKIDELLPLFVDIDKPKMSRPCFVNENTVIATNGRILLHIPTKYLEKEYEYYEPFVEWDKVYDKKETALGYLDNKAIESVLDKLEKEDIKEYKNCPECQGEGVKYCDHCDSEYDCKKCDGNGEISYKTLGWQYKHIGVDISINGCNFNPNYIDRLLKISGCTGENISVLHVEPKGCCYFRIGDIDALLMPVHDHDQFPDTHAISIIN